MANGYASNVDWDAIKQAKSSQYGLRFHADFFDEAHHKFDYQDGLVHLYANGDSEIHYTTPDKKSIWHVGDKFSVYNEIYNHVDLNLNDVAELALYPLLLTSSQLEKSFNINKKDNTYVLKPKINKKNLLISQINISLDKRNRLQSYTVTDKVGYQHTFTFHQNGHEKLRQNIQINYPKTAEVVNHDRYTKI